MICFCVESCFDALMTGYVALSRVRTRHDIWIYREFPHDFFTKKPLFGPDLLLEHLRGHDIDWTNLTSLCQRGRKNTAQTKIVHPRTTNVAAANPAMNATRSLQRHVDTNERDRTPDPQMGRQGKQAKEGEPQRRPRQMPPVTAK